MTTFWMPCPRCGEKDIEVEIVGWSNGRPATRLDPPEPAEVETNVVTLCTQCDFDGEDAEQREYDKIEERAWEKIGDAEEVAYDAATDRAYEEYKERKLFGDDR